MGIVLGHALVPSGADLVSLALLALSVPARADEPAGAVVWYRGSAECPAGTEFLQMLGERSAMARLADAGDHIDFVVTLVATPAKTVGRLERQTQTGTVAIRELRDASCKPVAEALQFQRVGMVSTGACMVPLADCKEKSCASSVYVLLLSISASSM